MVNYIDNPQPYNGPIALCCFILNPICRFDKMCDAKNSINWDCPYGICCSIRPCFCFNCQEYTFIDKGFEFDPNSIVIEEPCAGCICFWIHLIFMLPCNPFFCKYVAETSATKFKFEGRNLNINTKRGFFNGDAIVLNNVSLVKPIVTNENDKQYTQIEILHDGGSWRSQRRCDAGPCSTFIYATVDAMNGKLGLRVKSCQPERRPESSKSYFIMV